MFNKTLGSTDASAKTDSIPKFSPLNLSGGNKAENLLYQIDLWPPYTCRGMGVHLCLHTHTHLIVNLKQYHISERKTIICQHKEYKGKNIFITPVRKLLSMVHGHTDFMSLGEARIPIHYRSEYNVIKLLGRQARSLSNDYTWNCCLVHQFQCYTYTSKEWKHTSI